MRISILPDLMGCDKKLPLAYILKHFPQRERMGEQRGGDAMILFVSEQIGVPQGTLSVVVQIGCYCKIPLVQIF